MVSLRQPSNFTQKTLLATAPKHDFLNVFRDGDPAPTINFYMQNHALWHAESSIDFDCSVDSQSSQAMRKYCANYPTQVSVSCGKDASSSVNITWVTSSKAPASTVIFVAQCLETA